MGNSLSSRSDLESASESFKDRLEQFQCFSQIGLFNLNGRIMLAHDRKALPSNQLNMLILHKTRVAGKQVQQLMLYKLPWVLVRTEMLEAKTESVGQAGFGHSEDCHLRKEAHLLSFFESVDSFPQILCDTTQRHSGCEYAVLVTTLVGPSLEQIFRDYVSKSSLTDASKSDIIRGVRNVRHHVGLDEANIGRIVREMLDRIREFHDKGFIHCNISLESFHYGAYPRHKGRLFLVNYSHAQRFLSDAAGLKGANGGHKLQPVSLNDSFFASPFILQQWSPSRADDLISISYLIIFLWKGYLPWDPERLLELKREKAEQLFASRTTSYDLEELSGVNKALNNEIEFIKHLTFYTTETSLSIKEVFNKLVQLTPSELKSKIDQNEFAQICLKKCREKAYSRLAEIAQTDDEYRVARDRLRYIKQRRQLFSVLIDVTNRIMDRDLINLSVGALTELTAKEIVNKQMQTKENVRQMCDSLMEMKSQYKDIGFELKELFLVIYRKFVQHSGSSRGGSGGGGGVGGAAGGGGAGGSGSGHGGSAGKADAGLGASDANFADSNPSGLRHTVGVLTKTNAKPVKSGTGVVKAKDFSKIINGWEKVFDQDPKKAIGFVYSEDNEDMFYSPSEEISDAILAAIEEIQQGKTAAPQVSNQQKLGVETSTWSPEEKREFLEHQLKTFLPQKMEAKQIEEEKKRVLNQLIRDESFLRACKPFTDLPPTVKEFINICYQLGRDDVPKYERLYDLTRHWGGRRQELDRGRILTEVSDCKDTGKDFSSEQAKRQELVAESRDYESSCVRGQDLSILVEEYMEKLVEINYRPVSNPDAKPLNSRLEAGWI